MKFLLDKEIDLKKEDLLNSVSYAETLKQMILSSPHDSAFTIGVFGMWGSGKSSVIRTVRKEFTKDKTEGTKFILYDAWKYSGDSFRRTFLLQLRKELNLEKSINLETFYQSTNRDINLNRRIDWTYLSAFILVLIAGIILLFHIDDMRTDAKFTLTLIIGIVAILVNFIGRAFNDLKTSIAIPPVSAAEQFEKYFKLMIEKVFVPANRKKRLPLERLVIIIDNLDRCSSETAYEVLSDVKTFLSESKGVIFLIPVDDDALKRHIMKAGEAAKEAEEFLRKLFNITLRIKPFKKFDLYDFAEGINKKHSLGFSPTTIDIISKEFASNPRRIIQFFNNLAAELHHFETIYGVGFSKSNESLICKVLIIREEWPKYYKQLARNPNLLSNPADDPNETDAELIEFRSFLSITHSVNINTSYEVIEKVFSIYDRQSKVPSVVSEAINKKDMVAIESFLKDGITKSETLIAVLLEKIEIGIQRALYQTEVNNILEIICRLNIFNPLSYENNRRVHTQISKRLYSIIKHINELDALCTYASYIEEKEGFSYLNNHIEDFITRVINNTQNEEEYPIAKRLLISYVKVPNNKAKLNRFSDVFANEYKRGSRRIKDYDFPPEVLQVLIDDKLVDYIVSLISDTDDHVFLYEMKDVASVVKLSENSIVSVAHRLNELIPTLDNVDPSFIIGRVKNFNALVRNVDSFISEKDKTADLSQLYAKFTGEFSYQSVTKGVPEEFATNEEKESLAEFIANVFMLSNGEVEISQRTDSLLSDPVTAPAFYKALGKLKNNESILFSIKDLILKDTEHSEFQLKLIEYLFFHVVDNKYILEDELVRIKLGIFLRAIIDTQNSPILFFLEKWTMDRRFDELLAEKIRTMSRDDVTRLSEKLRSAAFDKFHYDKTFKNGETFDFLKAMAAKGSPNHVAELLKAVKELFKIEDKVNETLDILQEMEELTIEQINLLQPAVENITNPELREEALEMIAHKDRNTNYPDEKLAIIKARYSSDRNLVERNITRKVRKMIEQNKLAFTVTNALVDNNDPDPGKVKDFYIEYVYNGKRQSLTKKEGETISIP